jgi:hypothetical protein
MSKNYYQLANDGSAIGNSNHLIILGLETQIQLLLALSKK